MSSEGTQERAVHARQILEDPLVVEALDGLRTACQEQFFKTGGNDAETRERIWLMGQVVERFRRHFETMVAEGKWEGALVEQRKQDNVFSRMFG